MTIRRARVRVIRTIGLCGAVGLLLSATTASAEPDAFLFSGKPIHPACVYALVMKEGDRLPVVSSVSLTGCMASDSAKAEPSYQDRVLTFSDDAVLGGGSFGYVMLSTLENGLEILGILRVLPDGTEQVSVAAVDLVERPAIFDGQVVTRMQLEMIGEVRIKDMQLASLRTVGNVVHYQAGIGASRVDRQVDLTGIGKARKKKK